MPTSGFIPDYKLLSLVQSPPGTQLYRYRKPGLSPGTYTQVIIDPVSLLIQPTEKITPEAIAATQNALSAAIRTRVDQQQLEVVTKPGPGVVRISVSISGAELEAEDSSHRTFCPSPRC